MDVLRHSPRPRRAWIALVVGLAALAALATAPSAHGALGDLTPTGCIDDNDDGSYRCAMQHRRARGRGGGRGEPQRQVGLCGRRRRLVDGDIPAQHHHRDPDAAWVHQVVVRSGHLRHLDPVPDGRRRRHGEPGMGPPSTWSPGSATAGSTTSAATRPVGLLTFVECVGDSDFPACAKNMVGIDDPTGVTVSPDGESVYVADFGGNSVAWLKRNTTSGRLAPRKLRRRQRLVVRRAVPE